MEQQEIWKDIIGFEGYYKISNLGQIMSVERKVKYIDRTGPHSKRRWINGRTYKYGGKLLKPRMHGPYLGVGLSVNQKIKAKRIHRLIAIHFIPNPENKPAVNHKDGNKLNNSISNLEWVTLQENSIHARDAGLTTYYTGVEHPGSKEIYQYTNDIQLIKIWGNTKTAIDAGYGGAWYSAKHGSKDSAGYIWSFTPLSPETYKPRQTCQGANSRKGICKLYALPDSNFCKAHQPKN